jgi:hypothetical protein
MMVKIRHLILIFLLFFIGTVVFLYNSFVLAHRPPLCTVGEIKNITYYDESVEIGLSRGGMFF